jgi:hypothetical protein
MKKALTTRQKTVQMLLERWRQKQEEKDVFTPTKQPPSLRQRQPAERRLKIG